VNLNVNVFVIVALERVTNSATDDKRIPDFSKILNCRGNTRL
jgi:hypothetical protein